MGTEEVYKLLPEKDRSKQDQDLKPFEGDSEELKEAVQDILVRASVQSKMQGDKVGTIPGDIQLFLDNLFAPKLPWNRILQKYLNAFSKSDYSYKKPNRRFFPQYFLPSLHSQKLMDIAIAVDISGSVTDSDFKTFVSEIHSILRMMKPNKINLIQFDTGIHSDDVIRSTNDLANVKFKGRGGTDIRPVLQWADENKPQLLLVFTDGDFNFYGATTKAKALWLIHNNKEFKAPFGKIVHYEIKV
jgi:predicted metal-dependent peptidase